MSISLVSVNVERSKHLDLVLPFLTEQNADVVCIQELCERDIPRFTAACGPLVHFCALAEHPADVPETGMLTMGMGIFSKLKKCAVNVDFYKGSADGAKQVARILKNLALLCVDMEHKGIIYRIGTTHFTWTPDGQPNDEQRDDIQKLLALLKTKGEIVFCGDFNAPRGGEIFSQIETNYTDNIPPHYQTSLDPTIHRVGKIRPEELKNKMVDGLFSTPEYIVSNVLLTAGVSDHCAVSAMVAH